MCCSFLVLQKGTGRMFENKRHTVNYLCKSIYYTPTWKYNYTYIVNENFPSGMEIFLPKVKDQLTKIPPGRKTSVLSSRSGCPRESHILIVYWYLLLTPQGEGKSLLLKTPKGSRTATDLKVFSPFLKLSGSFQDTRWPHKGFQSKDANYSCSLLW